MLQQIETPSPVELPKSRPEIDAEIDEALSNLPEATQHGSTHTIRASWNFSLDHVRTGIARYSPESRQALVAAFRWCIDPRHPMSKPEFARRVGSSDNTIYKIYTGKYKHPTTGAILQPSDELIRNINKFLSREGEMFVSAEKDFVLTPTAKRIVTACDLARESRTPVFLIGPSHIGKSWTLERHYTPNNNHGSTIYTRMRAASGLGGMIRQFADDLGISDNSNTAALIDRIKHGLTPDMLPIFDEVHLLAHTYRKGSFHNCMEVLREILDRAGCGGVFCFTMLDAVAAAKQKELQQLWRRGVHKVFLPSMPTKQDVAMILEHNGLYFPDVKLEVTVKSGKSSIKETPYKILKQVAKEEALKAITERIRYAKKLAAKRTQKMDWTHFVLAHLTILKNAQIVGDWDDAAAVDEQ